MCCSAFATRSTSTGWSANGTRRFSPPTAASAARRLTTARHHHHDFSIATLHVHVDSRDYLEVSILKGTADEVRAFADSVVTQRGVRLGNLHIIPAQPRDKAHSRDGEGARRRGLTSVAFV